MLCRAENRERQGEVEVVMDRREDATRFLSAVWARLRSSLRIAAIAAALAAAALRLLAEPDLGLRLADRARSDVLSKYTWSAVRNGWRRAYGLPDELAGS